MRIFVLIPVFNRLEHTQKVLASLRQQTLAPQLRIIVINDGSSDGTAAFLASQPDVVTLQGDGNLWWGGAIELGLTAVHELAPTAEDYVLFLNNDTWFETEYVARLVEASRDGGGAAVGSAILEPDSDPPLTSIGPRVHIDCCAVWDILSELPETEARNPKPLYAVDALSGRGTLYPALLFERYGRMRPRLLPHYLADYEVAMRFARHGVPLLVSTQAFVYSVPVYGNGVTHFTVWKRYFSHRSSGNVMRYILFYMLVGTPWQRVTAPLRLVGLSMMRAFRACLR